MATRFGRRWPHGPKNVRYVLSRGEPTERTPLGNSYGPWSVRAIKKYGVVALDESSDIEVGLTKNSVVFDDEFQWFTETRRGIVTLFDNHERAIAQATKLSPSAATDSGEFLLHLERSETMERIRGMKKVVRSVRTVNLTGDLTRSAGQSVAAVRLTHTLQRTQSGNGSRSRAFTGSVHADPAVGQPLAFLAACLTAGRWTTRPPQIGFQFIQPSSS